MATKVGNGLDLLLQRIINLGDPTAPTDATTKQYVDNLIRGLDWKQSVKATTTANITLSGTQTVDGQSLAVGDRVLVKNQTTASDNGIYVVASSAWSRAADFNDGTAITASAAVTVEQGTTWADTVWLLTTDGAVTVGTTALTWSQLGGGITYTQGNGILISGTTVSAKGGVGIVVDATGIRVDRSLVPVKYAANVPSGSTSCVLTHNLGSSDVVCQLFDMSGSKPQVIVGEFQITDTNTVTAVFSTAPTSGQYRAVILG